MSGSSACDDMPAGPTLIQSLQRGLRLVEAVALRGSMTARQLSEATGIGLPTTYHLLRTLIHEGYLGRAEDGTYAAGPQLNAAANLELSAHSVRALRAVLCELRTASNATVALAQWVDGAAVVSQLLSHPRSPRIDIWVGMDIPLHATALGKTIATQLEPTMKSLVLPERLERFTSKTIVNPARLTDEDSTGDIKVAEEEFAYGVSCYAMAVEFGGAPAALSVGFAASTGTRRRERLAVQLGEAVSSIGAIEGSTCLDPDPACATDNIGWLLDDASSDLGDSPPQ